ncbi:MAG: ASCH domain-containing protein [Candidatus Acidiferrum sp.]
MTTTYALSLKQPWATLLVHGLKTVEVRNWPARRRGRILIHAARVLDPRPEAWSHVPRHLAEHALLVGGIVGVGDLTECVTYHNAQAFITDKPAHLNEADWFQPPVMYGFKFRNLVAQPFRVYSGWMRFFPVEEEK